MDNDIVKRMIGHSTDWGHKLSEPLDAIGARILELIQHDATLSVAEIAERVGLSSSPCWRRIKKLEEDGIIQRRVTILDREKLGLTFEVYCTVKLSLPTKQNLETFEQAVMRWPEVMQCATVTGAADYELRIVTASIWTQGIRSKYRREYWSFFGTLIRRYRDSPAHIWMGFTLLLTAQHFLIYSRHVSAELARDCTTAMEAANAPEFARRLAHTT